MSLHSAPATLHTSTHPSIPPDSKNWNLGLFHWARDRPLRFSMSQIFGDSCSVSCHVSWGLTERPTQPLVWLSLLCLYLHFHYPLSLSLALSLSPSPSLCVMPLFVWRLIKQLPSQPPQPSSSSPRHQLPATVASFHVCVATDTMKSLCSPVFCVFYSVCIKMCVFKVACPACVILGVCGCVFVSRKWIVWYSMCEYV